MSAEGSDPLGHPSESMPWLAYDGSSRHPFSFVDYFDNERFWSVTQRHRCLHVARMFDHIGHRFLHDPVYGCLRARG
jgi:hypothetical protein